MSAAQAFCWRQNLLYSKVWLQLLATMFGCSSSMQKNVHFMKFRGASQVGQRSCACLNGHRRCLPWSPPPSDPSMLVFSFSLIHRCRSQTPEILITSLSATCAQLVLSLCRQGLGPRPRKA